MYRKWSKEAIAMEIVSMYESGENLNLFEHCEH